MTGEEKQKRRDGEIFLALEVGTESVLYEELLTNLSDLYYEHFDFHKNTHSIQQQSKNTLNSLLDNKIMNALVK